MVVSVNVEAYLDNVTIKDPKPFLAKRLDTAVFTFTSLPEAIVSDGEISQMINKYLQTKNFSTMDQNNFAYKVTEPENQTQVINAFNSVNAKYMFVFTFDLQYPEYEADNQTNIDEPQPLCEMTMSVDVNVKNGEAKTLTLPLNSYNQKKKACVNEMLDLGVTSALDYVRENIIIDETIETSQIHTYEIKVINFKNMITTNAFFGALKQKGFVNSFKVTSFATNELLFNVETIFAPEILEQKIIDAGLNVNMTISMGGNGLVLDFNPVIPQ